MDGDERLGVPGIERDSELLILGEETNDALVRLLPSPDVHAVQQLHVSWAHNRVTSQQFGSVQERVLHLLH